ncbi:hypothetical protein [Mycobacterium sp. NPDC004974]
MTTLSATARAPLSCRVAVRPPPAWVGLVWRHWRSDLDGLAKELRDDRAVDGGATAVLLPEK